MASVRTYRDLKVWQAAMDLVEAVYRAAEELPDTERYGLRSQCQRAAVSIPSNIAEGFGRNSATDYARFLTIARGSLMELETQITLMVRLNLIDRTDAVPLWEKSQEVGKMLSGLRRAISRPSSPKASGLRPKASA